MAKDQFSQGRRDALRIFAGAAVMLVPGVARAQISDAENEEIDTVAEIHRRLAAGGIAFWLRGFAINPVEKDDEIAVAYEKLTYTNACVPTSQEDLEGFFAEALKDPALKGSGGLVVNDGYELRVFGVEPFSGNVRQIYLNIADDVAELRAYTRDAPLNNLLHYYSEDVRCLQAGVRDVTGLMQS